MDAEFLKKHVGTALAKGLAQVVVDQPEDGIDHLGKFLIQYADAQERAEKDAIRKEAMKKIEAEKAEIEKAEQLVAAEKQAVWAAQKAEDEALLEELREASVAASSTGDDIQQGINTMMQKCADHMKKRLNASSCYIGRLSEYPEGHEKAGTQLIQYEYATANNSFMVGKGLPKGDVDDEGNPVNGSGVTFKVFEPVEEEEVEPEVDEDGNPIEVEKPPPLPVMMHVENVLRNNGVKFFRFPMLGAYLAVDVATKSSCHNSAMDAEYLTASDEPVKEEGDEEAEEGEAKEEKTDAEPELDEDGNPIVPEKPKRVWEPAEVKEGHMVIACDTMGQNRPFNEDEILFAQNLSQAISAYVENITKSQFQCEVWLRREHFNANAALAEERAAAAETEATAKDEAMSKVGEETPEEDKAASDKEYDAQTAKTNAVNAKEHIQRVLGLQITPGAAVENVLATSLSVTGVDKSVFTDAATGVVSWALLKGMDLEKFFEAFGALNQDSFGESEEDIGKWREICGAMEKSDDYVAVGMLVDAINACIEWADAARVAKEALAARVAAEEEAKKAAEEGEGGDEGGEE